MLTGRFGGRLLSWAHSSRELSFTTGYATQAGLRRRIQEDAVAIVPNCGLWAVVDGMGGHGGGAMASRLVSRALLAVKPEGGIAGMTRAVLRCLRQSHEELNNLDTETGRKPGAAFIVLLTAADHYTAIWAGDARLYQQRRGVFSQVTQDHLAQDGHSLLQAIGGGGPLEPEIVHGLLRPRDRFLLCSDGITKTLSGAVMAKLLAAGEAQGSADALIAAVLAAGAPDDATGIVVAVH